MVVGDLLRFVCIYMVFVMGFSQAYYIIFLTFDNSEEENPEPELNPISSPMESFISMFLMSLGNFGDYYGGMEFTEHETHAKVSGTVNTSHRLLCYFSIADSFRPIHGSRGCSAYQFVDCHDGQHVHENRRDQKRMAAAVGKDCAGCRERYPAS